MDESSWNRCDRLYEMFAFAQHWLGDRKRRLFAVACCRRQANLLIDARCRKALDIIERYALGLESEENLQAAEQVAFLGHLAASERFVVAAEGDVPWSRSEELITQAVNLAASHGIYAALSAADHARWALSTAGAGWSGEQLEEAFQCKLLREIIGPVLFRTVAIDPYWLLANDGAVVQLAQAIEEGADDLYPILADALEDAGCSDSAVLAHCRENADHVRGCWLVDLLLDKG